MKLPIDTDVDWIVRKTMRDCGPFVTQEFLFALLKNLIDTIRQLNPDKEEE